MYGCERCTETWPAWLAKPLASIFSQLSRFIVLAGGSIGRDEKSRGEACVDFVPADVLDRPDGCLCRCGHSLALCVALSGCAWVIRH